jgi:ribonuclease P protein subunit POP4
VKPSTRLFIRPLIGLTAVVVQTSNKSVEDFTGQIIDETHGLITLFDGNRRRKIPKATTVFDITMPDGEPIRIDGKTLLGHPAERLRRAKRQRW